MNAVRVKSDLRLFRNDPAQHVIPFKGRVGSDRSGNTTYRFPSTFVPLPFLTVRCDPLGTGG